MNLNKLKQRLQHEFTKTHVSTDYIEALSDAIYGCDLTVTALETWIMNWITPAHLNYKSDKDYVKGVQFVAEQWEIIQAEDKRGEEL